MVNTATICWYRHHHENRNDLLRYGLMQLAVKGAIRYIEKDLSVAKAAGFTEAVYNAEHRHLSFLTANSGRGTKKIMVDSEDSFIQLSPLVTEADIYFIAGYNSDLFKHKKIPLTYSWQTENDVAWYQEKITSLINSLGNEFYKIKPFVPVGPNLGFDARQKALQTRVDNLWYRVNKLVTGNNYWLPDFKKFSKRYTQLLTLRDSSLKYDVVLKDTLWGWPNHRIKLHAQLAALASKFDIRAGLNWHQPTFEDGGNNLELNQTQFPMTCGGPIGDYEKMLSESKIGVFATGFHWGWRNIMTLTFLTGIPVLMDEPILEPYFDIDEFKIYYNHTGNWDTIAARLDEINKENWTSIKAHNQLVYDKYLSPAAVAGYFINQVS